MTTSRLRDLNGEDPYKLLDISPTAGHEEILAGYKRQMRKSHPDRTTGSEQSAKLLNIAKDILLDPELRSDYDRSVSETDPRETAAASDTSAASAWDSEDVNIGSSGSPLSSSAQSPRSQPSSYPPPHMRWPPPGPPWARTMPPGGVLGWAPEQHRQGWEGAAKLLRYLADGNPLKPLSGTLHGREPGELLFADTPLEYARFYATEVQYNPTTTIGIGSIPFMLATLAGSAISNSIAHNRAMARAAPQWRESHITRIVLTGHRFLANVRGQWLSFYHYAIAEFLPSAENYSLVLNYHDAEPLRLRGPAAPWVSVALGTFLYPVETLFHVPGLTSLNAMPPPGQQGATDEPHRRSP